MPMRQSRVLKKLRAGQVANCTKTNLSDPRIVDIAGLCGVDAIWTCREHVPNTLDAIENQVRAAKMHDIDIIVRVSRGSYSDLVWPLEMDATAIMVPHVMSAADAKMIAHQTKFHPIGRRALDGGNADGAYCTLALDDYLAQANRQRMVIAQIEDPEPMTEIDQIAATPGIDMLFFGPGDFTHGLGVPGKFDDPRCIEARKETARAAIRHGKFAGTVGSLANLTQLIDEGYRFISVGADVVWLTKAYKEMVAGFAALPAPGKAKRVTKKR